MRVKRIALFLPNWVGDVVMATPAVRAVREAFPAAELLTVCKPCVADVLAGAPWFAEVVPSDKRGILLRSVITMARELDMQVVAEGIKSEDDAIQLSQMGCDYGQSFLFGPPVGSESILRLLKERFPLMKRA